MIISTTICIPAAHLPKCQSLQVVHSSDYSNPLHLATPDYVLRDVLTFAIVKKILLALSSPDWKKKEKKEKSPCTLRF